MPIAECQHSNRGRRMRCGVGVAAGVELAAAERWHDDGVRIGVLMEKVCWSAVVRVIVFLAVWTQTATASTITVNSKVDAVTSADGQCTLREAIANVNAAADTTNGDCPAGSGTGDIIAFALTLPAQIKLTLGQLVVEQNVDIVGPVRGTLRITGAHAASVLRIATGASCSISSLSIEQGKADFGAGIRNDGTLTLTNCILKNNRGVAGGGIYNEGTAILTACTIAGNQASSTTSGSGGGGVVNSGTMTMTDCTLTGNRGGQGAGGIANGGTLALTNCTLDGNSGGQGGGIYNSGALTLSNCTITRNKARYGVGGGVLNIGTATLTNCTLDRNTAFAGTGSLGGGGIWHYAFNGSATALTNTIVAHGGRGRDCGGDPIISGGHNLDSDGTCFASGGSDLVNADPMLARPGNYGGPTPTLALCTALRTPAGSCRGASPALDAGDDAVTYPPDNLATDQRGLPRKAGAHVDIGACEAQ